MGRNVNNAIVTTLAVGLCVVGLVIVFREASGYLGWMIGNRVMFAGCLISMGVAVLVIERVRSIKSTPPDSLFEASPPSSRDDGGHVDRRTSPPAEPVIPTEEDDDASETQPLFPVGGEDDGPKVEVPTGDKAFFPGSTGRPSWMKHADEERREVLQLGAQS